MTQIGQKVFINGWSICIINYDGVRNFAKQNFARISFEKVKNFLERNGKKLKKRKIMVESDLQTLYNESRTAMS